MIIKKSLKSEFLENVCQVGGCLAPLDNPLYNINENARNYLVDSIVECSIRWNNPNKSRSDINKTIEITREIAPHSLMGGAGLMSAIVLCGTVSTISPKYQNRLHHLTRTIYKRPKLIVSKFRDSYIGLCSFSSYFTPDKSIGEIKFFIQDELKKDCQEIYSFDNEYFDLIIEDAKIFFEDIRTFQTT